MSQRSKKPDVAVYADGTLYVTGNTATADLQAEDIQVSTVYGGDISAAPVAVSTNNSRFTLQ